MRSMSSLSGLALLLVATITVAQPSLQEGSGGTVIIFFETTEPPTVAVLTADQVTNRGGPGSCRWSARAVSTCSSTCGGTQTIEVTCFCTLSRGERVLATETNCERDDVNLKPVTQSRCGLECPTTKSPSDEPTTVANQTHPTTNATTSLTTKSTAAASQSFWVWNVIVIVVVAVTVI